ncbi:hypothetical protein ABH940_005461 [Streptacidiphilus sp. BW17]|uniref:hypothetical protein n=1 Tax=Streptacidiphilus sp. BW17 TaxID=3156274 RepID=UPI003512BDB5
MSLRALPYRVPTADTVTAQPWHLITDDGAMPLPEALPDWDYQMDLHLCRKVRIDVDRVRAQTGLSADAVLGLSAVWSATGSNLSGPAHHVRLVGSGTVDVELEARLRGADLGGLLLLDTALVLAERYLDGRPSAPRRAGSVLWSHQDQLRLQGDAPQFPMAVIDFAHTSFPARAAWHLQISGSLESATMGSLLLLINEKNTVTATAFENAARPRPVDRAVLSAVYADAARTMLEHALAHPDFADDAEFPDDSLGMTCMALFDTLFPKRTITDVRLLREQSASLFASELQAQVRIFEESG